MKTERYKVEEAVCSHRVLGIPNIVLKWHAFKGFTKHESPYVVIQGIIKSWSWSLMRESIPLGDLDGELKRFEDWASNFNKANDHIYEA